MSVAAEGGCLIADVGSGSFGQKTKPGMLSLI
jgi:hypothetical protein